MSDQRYNLRGVSASKEDVHNAIKNVDKGIFPHAFCKIIPDILGGDPAWCNIMHADGAGTKSSLAYAYWRETGDLSVLFTEVASSIAPSHLLTFPVSAANKLFRCQLPSTLQGITNTPRHVAS